MASITTLQQRSLLIGNEFTDVGTAIQLYGLMVEAIADGNTATRSDGFHNHGMRIAQRAYLAPSWYVQWLGNHIVQGNFGYTSYESTGESHIALWAPGFDHPLTRGCVIRKNQLDNNAHIAVGELKESVTGPTVQNVVVEDNDIASSDLGVYVARSSRDVLVRNNRFREVREEVRDETRMPKVRAKAR